MSKEKLAVEMVYDNLWTDLISMKIKPASRINIHDLKRKYEVGINLVREALNKLLVTRLVEFIPNKGFRSTKISREDAADIYRCCRVLQPMALADSVRLADEDWRSKIVSANFLYTESVKALSTNKGDEYIVKYIKALRVLSSTVYLPIQDMVIFQVLRHLYDVADRYTFMFIKEVGSRELDIELRENDELIEALVSGNYDLASDLLTKHTDEVRKNVLSYMSSIE